MELRITLFVGNDHELKMNKLDAQVLAFFLLLKYWRRVETLNFFVIITDMVFK